MAGFDRFGKVWSNKGAISAPNATQFDQGFSYLGNTPPSVELFNAMFQERDEQLNWLFGQISTMLRRANITPAPTPDTQLSDAASALFGARLGADVVRLPGGYIMQWGTNGVILAQGFGGVAEAARDIVFPVAFPTACRVMQVTANDIGGPGAPNQGSSLQETAWILEKRTTGARIAGSAHSDGAAVGGQSLFFDWLAIGN